MESVRLSSFGKSVQSSTVEDGASESPRPRFLARFNVNVILGKLNLFIESNAGLLLIAAAHVFFTLMDGLFKGLNALDPSVSTLQIIAVRMAITYICCITYMLWRRIPDPFLGPKDLRTLLVFRGIAGFIALFGIFGSLEYLSLSDSTVLSFLSPFTTALAGFLFLNESFSRRDAIASLFSFVGVVLICRPQALFRASNPTTPTLAEGNVTAIMDFNSTAGVILGSVTAAQRLTGVGAAMLGVLGITGAYTSLRALGTRAHPLQTLAWNSIVCVLASAAGMVILQEPFVVPTQFIWFLFFFLMGAFGFFAQTLTAMGFQRETAGRGTLAMYTQIVFATIFERIVFHAVPSIMSIAGTIIIVGSTMFVALNKAKSTGSRNDEITTGTPGRSELVNVELEDGLGLLEYDELERARRLDKENQDGRRSNSLSAIGEAEHNDEPWLP